MGRGEAEDPTPAERDEKGPLGKERADPVEQVVDPKPLLGGNDHRLSLQGLPRRSGQEVRLGIDREDRGPEWRRIGDGLPEGRRRSLGRRVEVKNHFHRRQRRERQGPHAALEQVRRIDQAGQVMEDVLRLLVGPEPDDRKPGGLRLGTHQAQVGPDQGIQE